MDQSRFLYVSKQHMLTDSAGVRQMCYITALNESMALETHLLAMKICNSACACFWY
jgi:hypothetical protein